ncbi:hypothetical protein Halru_2346 [Halovivax ruber XH-70]|uniref:Divalent heavy-metal cations transporter n=1 Tax=Halovivax ruber (strain DSM 18193 / JCM 13892 / XH-70) TaxID=797302 RepID=L0IFE8_HALRX|nr:hypothetical protein [Halovivax ruber]AGB16931.1 hypothetical protein Halru_2346 [Halovivax ruber XH-70]
MVVVVPSADPGSVLAGLFVLTVALAHLLPHQFPEAIERRRHGLLSLAGGVSIVYAFVHLFPEIDHRRETIEGLDLLGVTLVSEHIYLVAFVGLSLFYGLERLASTAGTTSRDRGDSPPGATVFAAHVGGFSIYNAVIGYAIVRGETGAESVFLFTIAMALHLFGNDQAMHEHHPHLYARYGRFVLAAAVALGALIGAVVVFDPGVYTVALSLLTGGIVFNAIKNELPRTRDSRFWAFAVGAGIYGAILVSL